MNIEEAYLKALELTATSDLGGLKVLLVELINQSTEYEYQLSSDICVLKSKLEISARYIERMKVRKPNGYDIYHYMEMAADAIRERDELKRKYEQ